MMAFLLTAAMVFSMNVTAFAETNMDEMTPAAECTLDETCTADTHSRDCPMYEQEEEDKLPEEKEDTGPISDRCTVGEDCTAGQHQEGCPKARPETEEETVQKSAAEKVQELIDALPDADSIDPADEALLESIHNNISKIYTLVESEGLELNEEQKAAIEAVLAAGWPVETLDDDPETTDEETVDSGTCGEAAKWTLTKNADESVWTLTISGRGATADYASGNTQPWKDYNKQITKVIVEEGITAIGDRLFFGCEKLAEIEAPESLESYGRNAFNGCDSLDTLHIGKNVTSIASIGFSGIITIDSANTNYAVYEGWLYELDQENKTAVLWQVPADLIEDKIEVAVPGTITWNETEYTVTGIGKKDVDNYVFFNAEKMKKISFGEQITEIGMSAFHTCTALEEIDLSDITSIGAQAFYNCAALDDVALNDEIEVIPNNLFAKCTSLENIVLPEGLTEIGRYAFSETALTELEIPEAVTKIDDFAFQHSKLERISGGAGLTSLGTYVFGECGALKTVELTGTVSLVIPSNTFGMSSKPESIEDFSLENGALASGFKFWGTSIRNLELGEGVTSMPADLCKGKTSLQTAVLKGLTTIPDGAFHKCSNLKEVTLGEKLTSIGKNAFNECNLTEIIIPDSVTTIGDFAFDGNKKLISATLGEGITSLGGTFNSCTSLIVLDMSKVSKNEFWTSQSMLISRSSLAIVYVNTSDTAKAWNYKGTVGTTAMAVTNGGIFPENTVFKEGILVEPVKDGFDFKGWYTDEGFTNKAQDNKAEKQKTYYAKWEKVPLSISVDDISVKSAPYFLGDTITVTVNSNIAGAAVELSCDTEALKQLSVEKKGKVSTYIYEVVKITADWVKPSFTVTAKYEEETKTATASVDGGINLRNKVTVKIWESDGKPITDATVQLNHKYTSGQSKTLKSGNEGIYEVDKWAVSNGDYDKIVITLEDGRTAVIDDMNGSSLLSVIKAGTQEINLEYTFPAWQVTGKLYINGEPKYKTDGTSMYTKTLSGVYQTAIPYDELEEWAESQALELDKANNPVKAAARIYKDGGKYEPEKKYGANKISHNYVWADVTTYYKVTFDSMEGSNVEEQEVAYNEKATAPEVPEKSGYTFRGWYTEKSCENKYEFDSLVTKSMTLYAKWVDETAPTITGLENGKTYCETPEVTVEDAGGVVSVTVNGEKIEVMNGKFVLDAAEGAQVVEVTDGVGNKKSVTVTVNEGHTSDGGVVTKAATATTAGEKTYTCTVCNEVIKVETIPATGSSSGNQSSSSSHSRRKSSSDDDDSVTVTVNVQQQPAAVNSAKTGDDSPIFLMSALCAIAAAGIAAILLKKKRS